MIYGECTNIPVIHRNYIIMMRRKPRFAYDIIHAAVTIYGRAGTLRCPAAITTLKYQTLWWITITARRCTVYGRKNLC